MWTYSQSNGILSHLGIQVGTGYSGHGIGVNNPKLQDVRNVGPIPQGLWIIGEGVDVVKLGPVAIPLTAEDETNTFSRSGFWIHGDEIEHPGEELASDGCIILSRNIRELINSSTDKILQVV